MTAPSPRSDGAGTGSDPRRVALTALAAALAMALLATPRPADPDAPADPLPTLVVDPNTAPPGVLTALPGLGPVRLGRLLDARAERPFETIEEIDRRVRGIGPATLDALRPHLRIEPH